MLEEEGRGLEVDLLGGLAVSVLIDEDDIFGFERSVAEALFVEFAEDISNIGDYFESSDGIREWFIAILTEDIEESMEWFMVNSIEDVMVVFFNNLCGFVEKEVADFELFEFDQVGLDADECLEFGKVGSLDADEFVSVV